MSFSYDNAVSIDWNGSQFIKTARTETGETYNYALSPDGITWTPYTTLSATLPTHSMHHAKWTGDAFHITGNLINTHSLPVIARTAGEWDNVRGYSSIQIPNQSPSDISHPIPHLPVRDIEVNLEQPHTLSFPKQVHLALGSGGANDRNIQYSIDDGQTWQSAEAAAYPITSPTTLSMEFIDAFPLNSAAFAAEWNGQYWMAAGAGTNHTLAYSPDGIVWHGRGKYAIGSSANAIKWSADLHLWVAGGGATETMAGEEEIGGNALAYSHDGLFWKGAEWTAASSLSTCLTVQYNSTLWIAGGYGGMARSHDGKLWTPITGAMDSICRDVRWNGSFWMAIGTTSANEHTAAISSDGIHWTTHLFAAFTDIDLIRVSTSNSGSGGDGSKGGSGIHTTIVAGSDQAVYTTLNNQFSAFDRIDLSSYLSYVRAIEQHGSFFFAGGDAAVSNAIVFSEDGLNWSEAGGTTLDTVFAFAWNRPHEGYLQVKPGTVATGEGDHTLAYSADGILWKGLGSHTFVERASAAKWNGSLWVAVGSNQGIADSDVLAGPGSAWVATSINGMQWLARDTDAPLLTTGLDVEWNGDMWLATGTYVSGVGAAEEGRLVKSTNGIDWSLVALPDGIEFIGHKITWTGDYWLVAGSGTCTCLYSFDGIEWFARNHALTTAGVNGAFQTIGIASSAASSETTGYEVGQTFTSSLNADGWRSAENRYNAVTGAYEGETTTTITLPDEGGTVPVIGEWIEFTLSEARVAVQWIAGWRALTAASRAAYPKQCVLVGSSNGGTTWTELDRYESPVSQAPAPDDDVSPLVLPRSVSAQVLLNSGSGYTKYRLCFPAIYGGYSATYVEMGKWEVWMRPSGQSVLNIPSAYTPVLLPAYVLIPAAKPAWLSGTPYFLWLRKMGAEVHGRINGDYHPTHQLLTSGYITGSCHTEQGLLVSTSNNQFLWQGSVQRSTASQWTSEWSGQTMSTGLSSTNGGLGYNKSRIVAGGSNAINDNAITYHTLTQYASGAWTPGIQSEDMFAFVYSISSNSGLGPVYIPDCLLLKAKDAVSLIGPKYYEDGPFSDPAAFCIEFVPRGPHTNIQPLAETVVNYYRGDRGPRGPAQINGATGPVGPVGLDENQVAIDGFIGATGAIQMDGWSVSGGAEDSIYMSNALAIGGTGTTAATQGYALDVSGNVRAAQFFSKSLAQPWQLYAWSGDFATATIDYQSGDKYVLDMDAALSADFGAVLLNTPPLLNRSFQVQFSLDYRAVPVDRYVCESVQLGETVYPLFWAAGVPNLSTTINYYIQTIQVICSASGVWKVISTGQSFTLD